MSRDPVFQHLKPISAKAFEVCRPSKPSSLLTMTRVRNNTDAANVEYISNERSNPCIGAAILRHWAWLQKIFVVFLEKLFEKSAMFISRQPLHVIGTFLLVAIALTCGFVKLEVEENVKYLFLPEDSEASLDIRRARSYGFELELRQEEVIIFAKK